VTTGIDISSYQGAPDFAAVKAAGSVEFIYAKASEGESEVDPQFARNKAVCAERGLPFGAYHFFHPEEDPKQQAAHFRNVAGQCALIPMVDVEIDSGMAAAEIVAALRKFVVCIPGAVLIYSDYGFWNDSMAGSSAFISYPFWVAEYNSAPEPLLPRGVTTWRIWQHSCTGTVAGIDGAVDLDVLNSSVTLDSLKA
jgi:lysozyme